MILSQRLLNDRQGVKLPVIDSRAVPGRGPPGARGREVGLPERPGPALQGAYSVDGAACLPVRITHEELAIAVFEFEQALALPDAADVLLDEHLRRHAQPGRDVADFARTDPDVTRGPAAAVAAAHAGKM